MIKIRLIQMQLNLLGAFVECGLGAADCIASYREIRGTMGCYQAANSTLAG